MSGRKQHYLPQFLQRGFALQTSSGEWQAWVYRKDRSYRSNIKGIGAERDFYVAGDLDADAPITDAENEFASLVAWLRDQEPGPIDRAEEIARLIVHLGTRTAQLRGTLADMAQFAMDAIFSPKLLEAFMLPKGVMTAQDRPDFQESSQAAQVKVLAGDVAPVSKVSALDGIKFGIYTSEEELVLGDSAVFFKLSEPDVFRPFLDKGADFVFVALPLSPSRVLLGGASLPEICPSGLPLAGIKCSHEFFIGPNEEQRLMDASSLIGSNAFILSQDEMLRIIAEVLNP